MTLTSKMILYSTFWMIVMGWLLLFLASSALQDLPLEVGLSRKATTLLSYQS